MKQISLWPRGTTFGEGALQIADDKVCLSKQRTDFRKRVRTISSGSAITASEFSAQFDITNKQNAR